MDTKLEDHQDKLRKEIAILIGIGIKDNDTERRRLSAEDRRFMRYFWNRSRHEIRKTIPREIIIFFESEKFHPSTVDIFKSDVKEKISRLENKGYIFIDHDQLTLTDVGIEYMAGRYPRIIIFWEVLLEGTPSIVSFMIAAIAFLASIFGIIDFVRRYFFGNV